MENSLLIALSRQTTLKREMASVANNIANMNTHAYKRESMMFDDYLMRSKGGDAIMGDKLMFVRDVSQYRDMSEGSLEETGNPLDVAVHGEGFFVVETEGGNRYTRNGHFQLNDEGVVVTSDGNPVLTEDGEQIQTNPTDTRIEISRTGQIYTDAGEIGKLGIVQFENPQFMKKVSNTLYSSADAGTQVEMPHVIQGKLELSNVQPIIEMTRMIEVHRSYEKAKNLVTKEDERMRKALSLVRDQ
ncbi:Flagellar basal-body rod protein FlgF [Candidatus Terasakiella magnetica]|uniref:Flagellar basal-body rod protein FlgF n=1 Tax=Candidatus Terasakiella magnetica TaxID=1867952 RepID=A0A1C3RKV0_9PROT|nr:flagellar basal-body rod protein FlgF [Candidatus Terasakiella magnetica]SCA57885.1 Flagellar basal-body rod protein FlgF [Candidatus Terasakiella magnetica]